MPFFLTKATIINADSELVEAMGPVIQMPTWNLAMQAVSYLGPGYDLVDEITALTIADDNGEIIEIINFLPVELN